MLEEHRAGTLELTIDDCDGTCEVKSGWPNAEFEGNNDNKYKIKLTPLGHSNINKPRPMKKCGRRTIPVVNHIILRLLIKSGTLDGKPTIPKVSGISYGQVRLPTEASEGCGSDLFAPV